MANIGEVWCNPGSGYFLVTGMSTPEGGALGNVFIAPFGWLPQDLAALGWQKMVQTTTGGWTPVNPPVQG